MNSFLDHIPTFRRLFGFVLRPLLGLTLKFWKRAAFVVACLVTLLAAFYTVEKWRWKAAWNEYAAQARNRGVRLEPADFQRAPIPDDQNFGEIPFFQNYYKNPRPPDGVNGPVFDALVSEISILRSGGKTTDDIVRAVSAKAPLNRRKRNTPGSKPIDLRSTARESVPETAKAILTLLDEESGTVVQQLHSAIDRPDCQFPVFWDENDHRQPKKPPFLHVRLAAQLHGMRLTLHAAAGEGGSAFEDLRVNLRLADALKSEPSLVAAMIRVAILGFATDGVWAGLNERIWDDATLVQIEQRLAKIDLIAAYHFGIEAERAGNSFMIQEFLTRREDFLPHLQNDLTWESCRRWAVVRLFPTGWVYRSQIRINQLIDTESAEVDLTRHILTCDHTAADRLIDSSSSVRDYLFLQIVPGTSRAAARTAVMEASVRQARTACALERYRLKHQSYPDTLDELITAGLLPSIPRDPVSDAPMEYRLTNDGRYALSAPDTDRITRESGIMPPEWPKAWMPAARK